MNDAVKIVSMEIENFKRIRAMFMEVSQESLVIFGGDNEQGKTSVLDAIAWSLGGSKYEPSRAKRDGSATNPHLKVTLSNGLVVERDGKNSTLKVTDPTGQKAGQRLVDSFISELAINPEMFINASSKDKAKTLLKVIGVSDELYQLEQEEKIAYSDRTSVGRMADKLSKAVSEMPEYPDLPDEPISMMDMIAERQRILAKNASNDSQRSDVYDLEKRTMELGKRIRELEEEHNQMIAQLQVGRMKLKDLVDESTEDIDDKIRNADSLNVKIRANQDRVVKLKEAMAASEERDALTEKIEECRRKKKELLDSANLPLPGLSIEDGELVYNGQQWDNMSGSARIRVATAIVHAVNPACGFVLIDKLEQMDSKTLNEFGEWLAENGLQAIATRVSKGDECSFIIEDGRIAEDRTEVTPMKDWRGGF